MSKKRHGHHGGAWKVAYADFVTAMMALFLVLWLTSQDTKIKQAVERSFKNPFATLTKESTGLLNTKESQSVKSKEGNFDSAAVVELNFLRKISEEIMRTLAAAPESSDDDPLKVEITSDGMRINIFDHAKRPVFERDSAVFTDYGQFLISTLSWQVAYYSNVFRIEIEGHTEQGHKARNAEYGGWELSADRANAARRKMIENGVISEQVQTVAGFADTVPIRDVPPTDERNRRVTLMLRIKSGNR